jgi:hypothetical protein
LFIVQEFLAQEDGRNTPAWLFAPVY